MKKVCALLALGLIFSFTPLLAGTATGTWGEKGFLTHPGTLSYKTLSGKTTLVFDISALPAGTSISRARLIPSGGEGYHFFPADESGKITGAEIKLVEPQVRWFDATEALRAAVKAGAKTAVIPCQSDFTPGQTTFVLEIAFSGECANAPEQVSGIRVLSRPGQPIITWKEIEDISEGNANVTWGQMVNKVGRIIPYYGMVLKDKKRELTYRIYRHGEPITEKTIGEAEFLNEVLPGTVYTDTAIPKVKVGEHGPRPLERGAVLTRIAFAPDKPEPPGNGVYVHTAAKTGKAYYAVVSCVNGVENTREFSDKNIAGPFEEKVETPAPLLYADTVTKLGGKGNLEHHEQWYHWWTVPPLSPLPRRIDVVVSICPKALKEPASLTFNRGHAWGDGPEPVGPGAHPGVNIAHCTDSPDTFWMGLNDGHGNLRGMKEGHWAPFPMRRQKALVEWACKEWKIDRNQIISSTGCWGMMEIEDGDLYAWIHGWGLPEVTKGFQAWGRSNIWGGPALYADRPREEDPYYRQDYGNWVRLDPARETPWFSLHTGWGAHFTEMGWPSLPRFLRGMIDTKRPFVFQSGRIQGAMGPKLRLNQSLPAFGNCTLDDNPGNGDLGNGVTFSGQLNGYLLWDTETITDAPGAWEMTVWLDTSAPLPDCAVDVTPRRCQQFKAKPGDVFKWTNTGLADGKLVESGDVAADQYGLTTLKGITVSKGRNRIVISR